MMKYTKDILLKLYNDMTLIRITEESFVAPISRGEITCPVHLYTGQEAIAVGLCSQLKTSDYIFGGHRSHGHYLAKGGDLNQLVAEVYCKQEGCSKGRGGSMHLIDVSQGVCGTAPIVAGTVSLAVGAAIACKIAGDGALAVSFLGDGATGEGVLYESLNLAALYNLPVLFVCENNLYSTHMGIDECRPNRDIYRIAEPFGVQTAQINGNDVLEVYDVAGEVIERCRSNQGPAFLECRTYRFRGHVGPDDNIQGQHTDIRPKQEILEWLQRDPISLFESWLLDEKACTLDELNNIKRQCENRVRRAFSFAHSSAYPRSEELEEHTLK